MANTIRIKRRIGGATGAPSTLGSSELAFNENSGGRILYYGLGDNSFGVATSVIAIGGPDFAYTATTNANLTGHVTSVGNAAVLGSFTSAQLATALTDETGTGANVFATSPTLVTPVLGVATATTVNKITITQPATGGTLTIVEGATLTASATGSVSGTNTGDNAANTLYSGLVSNVTHTGDATGSTALTVVKINGVLMSGLATGILKNTTTTGAPSIAVAADFPTLNQNTSGTAAGLSATLAVASGGTGQTSSTGSGAVVLANTPTLITPNSGAATGTSLVLSGNLTVNGTTTTISSTTLSVADKNIELAQGSITEAAADGGGLTLHGLTDHTWNWVLATTSWTSSDHINVASGKSYYINGTVVLSATSLGSGIILDGGTF
jgi:hypothetical protein